MVDLKNTQFATQAIHGGYHKDSDTGALTPPIYQTSTFVFDSAEQGGRRFALEESGYIYSRLGNPTNTLVEERLALLEGGEASMSASSGMGAISATLWTALQAGDHVVAGKTLYGCTFALLNHGLTRYGVEVSFVDTTDLNAIKQAMKDTTKVVYLETPANPDLRITDIQAVAEMVHQINENCMVIVDNTFCTPYLQKPLSLGADVVIHSATKYLNGHGDVIAGFVVGKKAFIDQVRLFGIKDMTGATLGAFEAYLTQRGMKTLPLRMDKHCRNAMEIATFLEGHKNVTKVFYPGLPSFSQYDLAKKQMRQAGGMISFEVKGGFEAGKKLLNALKLCTLAVSLGDCETLIQHPASMTHSPYTPEERQMAGISDSLIRLSVGLEAPEDIIADLEQALNQLA